MLKILDKKTPEPQEEQPAEIKRALQLKDKIHDLEYISKLSLMSFLDLLVELQYKTKDQLEHILIDSHILSTESDLLRIDADDFSWYGAGTVRDLVSKVLTNLRSTQGNEDFGSAVRHYLPNKLGIIEAYSGLLTAVIRERVLNGVQENIEDYIFRNLLDFIGLDTSRDEFQKVLERLAKELGYNYSLTIQDKFLDLAKLESSPKTYTKDEMAGVVQLETGRFHDISELIDFAQALEVVRLVDRNKVLYSVNSKAIEVLRSIKEQS